MKPFKILWDTVQNTKGGYKYVQTDPVHPNAEHPPDRSPRVYLLRVILENSLGRLLKDDEESHHKDNNHSNYNLSNLELTTHDEHQKDHANKRKFWKKSPMNKPGREAALRVIKAHLSSIEGAESNPRPF